MDTTSAWLTIDEAAARLGVSTRTLQRRVHAGTMRAQRREDGRTLVEVEASACPTPVVPGELVERLERQAEDTNRVAALAAVAAEQTALSYRERLQTVEVALSDARAAAGSWRKLAACALSVSLSAVVGVGYLAGERGATARQVSDMSARLDEAAEASNGLREALAAATAARQASDSEAAARLAEAALLRAEVDRLRRVSDTDGDEVVGFLAAP
jgi:excisionase family DNA binding protein